VFVANLYPNVRAACISSFLLKFPAPRSIVAALHGVAVLVCGGRQLLDSCNMTHHDWGRIAS
jgi:hypothetical protein